MGVHRQFRLVLTLSAVLAARTAAAPPKVVPPDAPPAQPFPPAEARRAPGAKDPPEVTALLRQRRDVVRAEVELARKYLGEPGFRADVWEALAERLLVAETDAVETAAERVAAYRAYRDNLKSLEDRLQGVPEPAHGRGHFEYGQKLRVHGQRLRAAAWLLRAERGAGDDDPAVREALRAWRDAVRRWAAMWLESKLVLAAGFAANLIGAALEADEALAATPAEHAAAYRAYRDRLAAVEKDVKGEMEKKRYDPADYLRLKALRCEADVALGRLSAAGEKAPAADPPAVRAALAEWAEAVRMETEINRKRYEPGRVTAAEFVGTDEGLLRAELAAATKPEESVAAYKKFFAKLKEVEAIQKARSEAGRAGKEDFARATFNRAAAELTLARLTAPPGGTDPPRVRQLLKEQRDALRTELAAAAAGWAAGRGDLQLLQETAGRLLLAELATADTPAERLAAYRAHAETMRSAEAAAKALADAKKGTEAWVLWARGARLEAEVWLLRATRALAPATGP
jgi:hypothetical protein